MPGEWHNKMEEYFPKEKREVQFEVKFMCQSNNNTTRRTDVMLNGCRTLEIQHSHIKTEEIVKRCKDWKWFGREIIWFVDGNTYDVVYTTLSTGHYLIEFNCIWKYESFKNTYQFILLDIGDKIFKIPVNEVKSKMIICKEYKTIEETIQCLNEIPESIWQLWEDDNEILNTLQVFQKGAGNGKTYSIWKSIIKNEDKTDFIIVTKQHSAKEVIRKEFVEQRERWEEHFEYIDSIEEDTVGKHIKIKYRRKKNDNLINVYIGTIDSFIYNLTEVEQNSSCDFFKLIRQSIRQNGICCKLKEHYNCIRFAGDYIKLGRTSELWIDEVQDLDTDYLFAIEVLMLQTKIDVKVVGDKLQSLEYEQNFMTYLLEQGLPKTKIEKITPENNNRRIKVKNMKNKINNIVDFQKFELPEISTDEEELINCEKPFKIIETDIYNYNVFNEVLTRIQNEVQKNHYEPKDFLIIFPIMKTNTIAEELQTKITEYWTDYYDNNEFVRYAYLHKHEEGVVIDTKESENATRLMSIRSSKGDGRKVVFVIGCNEKSLNIVSQKQPLVYESHLHVALTRSINKIYFELEKNNDKIHKRFAELEYVELLPTFSNVIKIDQLINYINKDKLIDLLETNNVNIDDLEESNIQNQTIIDYTYFCIRYQVAYYIMFFEFLKVAKDDYENTSMYQKLKSFKNLKIKHVSVKLFYTEIKKWKKQQYWNLEYIPVCKLTNKENEKLTQYADKIYESITKTKSIDKLDDLSNLNTLESIILIYFLQLHKSLDSIISPNELYNILNFYEKNSKEKYFLDTTENINLLVKKLSNEIRKIDCTFISWDFEKTLFFNGEGNFDIKNNYPFLGYSSNYVFHIVFKSCINKLNYWETMIEVLLERFLIYEPNEKTKTGEDSKNKEKYKDKKIITYIVSFEDNNITPIYWEWDKLHPEVKEEIKNAMVMYYESFHKECYNYYKYFSKNKDKWKGKFPSACKYIANEFENKNFPQYVISFFNTLHKNNTKIDEVEFMKSLNDELDEELKIYLGLWLNEDDED